MKKLFLLSALFCMMSFGAFSQIFGYGAKAGVVFSNVNGFPGSTQRVGVVGGAFGDVMISNWFGMQTELLYCMQGWQADQTIGKLKVAMDYIKMPVFAKFYMIRGLNFQLGAQFGYLINAKYKRDESTTSFTNQINRFGVDFMTGLGYEFDFGLVLEGRYSLGINDLQSEDSDLSYVKNGALMVTAGWRF